MHCGVHCRGTVVYSNVTPDSVHLISMTTRERREYSSSNVVRTLHPSRPLSPSSHHHQQQINPVDHNLDYLLDDLQSSVERTKSKDAVHYLAPSNTTTVVRERSVSPGGGESRRVYKTSHYEYSTSSNAATNGGVGQVRGGTADVPPNINSLDSLLLDLKHERERSLERAENPYSNVGIDDGLLEPSSNVTRTTKTYTSTGNIAGRQPSASRELHFDSPLPAGTTTKTTTTVRQSRSRQRSPATETQTHVTRDVSYDSDPTVDNLQSTSSTINRSYNTNSYRSSSRGGAPAEHVPQQLVPYNEFVDELDAGSLPAELSGLPLDGGLLPGPGTKVTTTIKTFTYEIPGEAPPPLNSTTTTTYRNVYPSAGERDIPSPHPIASNTNNTTTIYKNESYNTINRNVHHDGPAPPRRSVSPIGLHTVPAGLEPPVGINKSVTIKRETTHNTTNTSNVYPAQPQQPQYHPYPVHGGQSHAPPPPQTTTYVYQQDVHNTNTNNIVRHPSPGHDEPPAHAGPGPKQTYLYKREVTNTKNTVYGPGPHGGRGSPQPLVEYPSQVQVPMGPPAGHLPPQPAGPTTIMYNYSTNTSTNTSTRHGHGGRPDDSRQPLLPFPVDGGQRPQDGSPPKRLDDLLATFGDANGHGPNHRGGIEEPYTPRKEINTALTTGKAEPIVEPKATMKPIAGPPVYYPPGKEVVAHSEQSEAAWRAQGGYAKASGKYEYEAGSKSKSSSKSGAAVVPVCLPLCCAMPCSIM